MSDDITLRLRYFPFPGRAGAIRDTLRIGGIRFEDVHVSAEDFQAQKAAGALPFGSLPVLDLETPRGTVSAAQSNAILRFVGRRAGLYPVDDPVRALKVDEALDLGEELYHVIGPSIGEQDAERRMAMRKVLAEQTLPLGRFPRAAPRRQRPHGFRGRRFPERRRPQAPLDHRQAHQRQPRRDPEDAVGRLRSSERLAQKRRGGSRSPAGRREHGLSAGERSPRWTNSTAAGAR